MESALSQGAHHHGEAYWGTGKGKMTGAAHPLCLDYMLFECIYVSTQEGHFAKALWMFFMIIVEELDMIYFQRALKDNYLT